MKKIFILFLCCFIIAPVYAYIDKTSEEYLKNKKHIAIMNPLAESIVQREIVKALKKQASGKYKVKFTAYNLNSLKKGVFKHLEITGKNVNIEDIEIPYFKIATITDYNYIDYTKDPIVFLSDIIFDTVTYLDEYTINQAIHTEEYQQKLQKINNKIYPMLIINDVRIKIRNSKAHIIIEYNFPIAPFKKNKTVMISANFLVDNGKVKTYNMGIDNAYGNLPFNGLTNLVNMLNPLSFTLKLIDTKNCNGKVENIVLEDDIVKINGKIYIEGDNK